ncbi:MAG TPA: hypothetical protein VHW72_02805 [Candidatus Angelobacter sp.]|jgi:hypothetical protein|nr:hypothetical protein [Candidatus Angelobacter sp.]
MSLNTVQAVQTLPVVSVPVNQPSPLLGDNLGAALFSELQARYSALCRNGNIYVIDSDSVTLAAAHTTKGAAATIKLINGFVNPFGSGVNVHVLVAKSATVSGTPAGPLYYNAQSLPAGASVSNVATGTIRSHFINTIAAAATPNSITPEVNVVITRSDSATTAFTQYGVHGGPAAIAAGAGIYNVIEELAGSVIVPPGTVWGLAATGAGTSHVVQSTIVFAVLPV